MTPDVTDPNGTAVIFEFECSACDEAWSIGDRVKTTYLDDQGRRQRLSAADVGAVGECPSCGKFSKSNGRVVLA